VTLREVYDAYRAAERACHVPPSGRPCTPECTAAWRRFAIINRNESIPKKGRAA